MRPAFAVADSADGSSVWADGSSASAPSSAPGASSVPASCSGSASRLRPSASTMVASTSRSSTTWRSASAAPASGASPFSTKAWKASHISSAEPFGAVVATSWTTPDFFSRSETVERASPWEGAGRSRRMRRRAESTWSVSEYSGAKGR